MALSTKTIKRRIKSIANTKKITKAMEMISAVKMRRAVKNDTDARAYSNIANEILENISKKSPGAIHALLQVRKVKKIAIIFITSNRGLAGGFTTKLLQETNNFIKGIKNENPNAEVEIILMGKKGRKIYQYFKHTIIAEFEKMDITTHPKQIFPLARMVVREYIEKKYDQVFVAYTHFNSAIKQLPLVKQILPLKSDFKETVVEVRDKSHNTELEVNEVDKEVDDIEESRNDIEENFEIEIDTDFLFEPSPIEVLEVLLPRLIETQIYQAILESDASEHSARMMTMQSASDAAGEMIQELNTTFNKARQAAITTEIMEVIGGAAALE
jgi:F-type H+-transporting ATPase subunit gamma